MSHHYASSLASTPSFQLLNLDFPLRTCQSMVNHQMMFIDGTSVPEDLGLVPSTRARRGGALDTSGGGAAAPSDVAEGGVKIRKDGNDNGEGGSSESEAEEAAGGGDGATGGEDGGRLGGRSRREGKARVVYVNGHPVLKENMWVWGTSSGERVKNLCG